MRNPPRRKLFHRTLMLGSIVASFIVIPTAFAHAHHSGSSYAGRHVGFSHHSIASVNRSASRDSTASIGDDRLRSATASLSPNERRHVRVPDEEEIEQPEQ